MSKGAAVERPDRSTDAELAAAARSMRRYILEALHAAGSGHGGSSLSIADLLAVLFLDAMDWSGPDRDRFVLSKGHAAPAVYAGFCELGLIDAAELKTLRKFASRLQGHPDMTRLPFLDAGTGALGQGLSITIGYALAARIRGRTSRHYCIVGDGEIQEGQIWEAAMFAAARRLDTVCCIVDCNRLQNETWVDDTLPMGSIADKWRSFDWNVLEIDGHDLAAIRNALATARAAVGRPTAIVAATVKGKGVSFMENDNAWHAKELTAADFRRAMAELKAPGR